MADERTYGFNRDDAESLLQGIGNGENWFPEIRPRGGGGSGVQIISFSINSSDPLTRSADVEIRQRTFPGTVFGSTLDDTNVIVYDTDGCYLNEPNVDLTGRLGKAVLMLVDDEAAATHFADSYEVPEKYWNVLTLCCPHFTCE